MKDFTESPTYLTAKYIETLDCVDELREQLLEKVKLLEVLQKKIEKWE